MKNLVVLSVLGFCLVAQVEAQIVLRQPGGAQIQGRVEIEPGIAADVYELVGTKDDHYLEDSKSLYHSDFEVSARSTVDYTPGLDGTPVPGLFVEFSSQSGLQISSMKGVLAKAEAHSTHRRYFEVLKTCLVDIGARVSCSGPDPSGGMGEAFIGLVRADTNIPVVEIGAAYPVPPGVPDFFSGQLVLEPGLYYLDVAANTNLLRDRLEKSEIHDPGPVPFEWQSSGSFSLSLL